MLALIYWQSSTLTSLFEVTDFPFSSIFILFNINNNSSLVLTLGKLEKFWQSILRISTLWPLLCVTCVITWPRAWTVRYLHTRVGTILTHVPQWCQTGAGPWSCHTAALRSALTLSEQLSWAARARPEEKIKYFICSGIRNALWNISFQIDYIWQFSAKQREFEGQIFLIKTTCTFYLFVVLFWCCE